MSNRRYTSQFHYNFERSPVRLMGAFTQTGATGAFATIVKGGVTGTAVIMGTAANSYTLTYVGGGTAGAEVVTVSGFAISVTLESGVSTITQVRTALNASTAAAAIAAWTGTSATVVAAAASTSFASGADTSFTVTSAQGNTSTAGVTIGMTLTQIGTGAFQITLADPYNALLQPNIAIQKASATDIKPQVYSVATGYGTAQAIKFRTNAVATPTNLASGDVLYIDLTLRNSSGVTF